MKTEGVEEGGQAFHEEEDRDGEEGKRREDEEEGEASEVAGRREAGPQHHRPQHLRQL